MFPYLRARSTSLWVWPDTRMSTPSLPANFTRELSSPQYWKNQPENGRMFVPLNPVPLEFQSACDRSHNARKLRPKPQGTIWCPWTMPTLNSPTFVTYARVRSADVASAWQVYNLMHCFMKTLNSKASTHVSGKLKSWSASPQTIWQSLPGWVFQYVSSTFEEPRQPNLASNCSQLFGHWLSADLNTFKSHMVDFT